MKILLLGTRGVGKTTLIHSMYGHFQEGRGFTLGTSDGHAEMLSVYKGLRRGQFPDPSSQRKQYDLTLSYGGNAILNFSWIDYQGIIYEDAPLSSSDLKSLESDIEKADAVICFFEQREFSENNQNFLVTTQNLTYILGRMNGFMPVSFVVTKCDLRSRPFTKRELLAPLSEIVDAISDNDHIIGSLLQVSCGRKEWNIDLPLLFVLYFGVIIRNQQEYEELTARQKHLMNRSIFSDIGDWLDSRLSGYGTDYEILSRRIDSYNASAQWRKYATEQIEKRLEHEITF
jgi:GTPase SAR1 family protein